MFSALRYSNFRWFWLNGATQAMGQGMQFLTIGILVLDSTDSSYQLGLVIFAYGVPNLAFSLVGGIIADRTDRLRLLVSTRVVDPRSGNPEVIRRDGTLARLRSLGPAGNSTGD